MVLLMPMTFVGKPLERKLRVSRYIIRYRYGLWYPHLAPRPRSKIEATLSRAKRPLGRIDWVDARMGWIVELRVSTRTSLLDLWPDYGRLLIADIVPLSVSKGPSWTAISCFPKVNPKRSRTAKIDLSLRCPATSPCSPGISAARLEAGAAHSGGASPQDFTNVARFSNGSDRSRYWSGHAILSSVLHKAETDAK